MTAGAGGERHNGGGMEGASITRDTRDLIAAIEAFSSDLGAAVREQMEQRPYVTLGLGFLAGYVLGGGLSFKVGTLLLGAAGRAALASVLERAAEPSGGER